MFEVGSRVIYKANGVCIISEIRRAKMSELSQEKDYYILKPINDPNYTIYVPVDNEALTSQMKEILSSDEIIALIKNMPNEQMEWIEDNKQRNECFKNILMSGSRKELIRMVKAIYNRKQEQTAIGKKLYAADENAMKKAEKVLFDEFATVLNIKQEEVLPFIIGQLECGEKEGA